MVYDRDRVTHPSHYTSHPSGIECIEITEHMPFCLGNAIKYIWRAGQKGDAAEDLAKAIWYLEREISRISGDDANHTHNDNDNDNESVTWNMTGNVNEAAEDYAPVDWNKLRDTDEDDDYDYECGNPDCDCDSSCFEDDEDDCGAFDCDCDGSCFEMRDDEADEEDDDTYSDGRRRVTIAELRKRLKDDPSGDDPLQLLVTSILCHTLTSNLVDALGPDEDDD